MKYKPVCKFVVLFPGSRYLSNSFPRASTSEETSNGTSKYAGEDRDGVVTVEDVPPAERNVYNATPASEAPKEESNLDGQTQTIEILDNLNVRNYINLKNFLYMLVSW